MRYNSIDNVLFIENREKFFDRMKNNSVAIFQSNDIMPTNADGTMPFKQNSDLFYLTGIDQEETVLVMVKNKNNNTNSYLFLKETSELIAIWEGHKLSLEQGKIHSGIENCFWLENLTSMLESFIFQAEYIYLNTNEHARATKEVETRNDRFVKWCKNQFPLHKYERSAPILHQLRFIKSEQEIALIEEAGKITGKAFQRILKFIKPNVYEFEIEAEIIHEFLINRSRGHAFQPILASGQDSCVLHYIENNKQCQDGDILLIDFGAEYANYNGDVTRCVPINGKFTERQKAVYNAVLTVKKEAEKLLIVGNTFSEYNKAVVKIMEQELIKLGLFTQEELEKQDPKKPLYRKYFMHGISHSLGLDVHDVDDRSLPFSEGMIFTCEPGIYILEESIGIRLEDDILITEKGPKNLTSHIPIEVEDIEKLMN